jgi:RNA polymerase sigma factor (TIGR02999 family)
MATLPWKGDRGGQQRGHEQGDGEHGDDVVEGSDSRTDYLPETGHPGHAARCHPPSGLPSSPLIGFIRRRLHRYWPMPTTPHQVTTLLAELRGGRHEALAEVVGLVYAELRRIGTREKRHSSNDTLNPTALVHEAYLKLVVSENVDWRDRAHFLGVAAVAMRRILVDRARARLAVKRGGGQHAVTLDEGAGSLTERDDALLALDDALSELALVDQRLARVVECRFYGGLSEEETAEAVGISLRTVRRDWVKARGLLSHALKM